MPRFRFPLALAALFGAAPAFGEEPNPTRLPAVPVLRLSLPALVAPPTATSTERSGAWLQYWQAASIAPEWRGATDAELRLRLETAHLAVGALSLSAGIETVPERERDCHPSCTGPDWTPSLLLKYDAGSLGPLQQAGPSLQVGGKPTQPAAPGRRLFNVGFGGAF